MEGAQAFQILARASQGDVTTHHFSDVGTLLDLPNELLRYEALAHWGSRSRPRVIRRTDPTILNGNGLDSELNDRAH